MKFQVVSQCGRALDYPAEQGCAVSCRSTRVVSSCLLLLGNLTLNPVPLLGQNKFHCLNVEMFFCVVGAWSLWCGRRRGELLVRQEGYLEISTHKMGAIISPPGESLFINVCKML